MTSVVELFPKSRKLVYDARQQLSQVQNGILPSSDLDLSLKEFVNLLDIMDSLLTKETPAQRQIWKRKLIELRSDSDNIKQQLHYHERMMHANSKEQQERDELLTLRRRRVQRNNNNNNDVEHAMQNMADESKSLHSSKNMVSELLNSGQAQLGNLKEQRERMSGLKSIVLDMGNRIGVSQSTMRMIERRYVTDFYFVLGGMGVTLLVIYLVWLR